MSTIFFIMFFSHRDGIRHFCDDVYNISSCDSSIKIFGATVPDPVFPVVTGFIGILYAIAVVLIGHLALFHCYLSEYNDSLPCAFLIAVYLQYGRDCPLMITF